MITDSFDDKSEPKINPKQVLEKVKADVCIITFSNIIEEYVLKKYKCDNISEIIEFSHSNEMENVLWRNENE